MGKFNIGDIVKRKFTPLNPFDTTEFVVKSYFRRDCWIILDDGVTYSENHFDLVFPSKWYIEGCKELRYWQEDVMNNKTNALFINGFCYTLLDVNNFFSWEIIHNSDVTEINFRQFKKYVLKIEIKKQIKLIRKDVKV